MTSRQIEMTWRCTSCSAKNLGRFKVCQKCNSPKDGSEEYEMPEDPSKAASVTEASLLAHVNGALEIATPPESNASARSGIRSPTTSSVESGLSSTRATAGLTDK
jgi:hypothetical protein